MYKIEKRDWLPQTFAELLSDQDVLRAPEASYQGLGDKEKDKLRQTQVFAGEVVRKLGVMVDFALVMKFDGTIGWVPLAALRGRSELAAFVYPKPEPSDALSFLKSWVGVPYHWGGLTRDGIDCSGLTQLYFLSVHGKLLPKNSRDQRKLGITKSFERRVDHDLVFCHPKSNPRFHHVAIYYGGHFWHARRTGGVVCQDLAQFLATVNLEETKGLI